MTREEAIAELNVLHKRLSNPKDCEDGCYSWEDGWYVEAIDMAIKALQREIPKNPIVNYVADSDGARRLNEGWTEDSFLCPVCHTYFGEIFEEGYCRACGQKLIQKRVRVIEP